MSLRRSLRARAPRDEHPLDSNPVARLSPRLTRAVASTSVTVDRSSSGSSEDFKRSLCITLRMPAGKLREATSGSTRSGRRSVNVFTDNPIVSGPRTSRPRKRLVEVNTSEEEEDLEDQEEDEVDDEDAPGEDDDEEDDDVDADGDLDMDDAPPQPPPKRGTKAVAANAKSVKSVEAKEMELEEDEEEEDEELSEPDFDAEGEPDEESGVGNVNAGEEELEDDDAELDSDDETPTLDESRMTKRQRGSLGNDFLQLPMEPQVKKHLTAEERAMRRAEMARRRKNLSEKRNEEEKMDTINRLLRKQAPKRRGRIPAAEAAENASADQETQEVERPDPVMVRWVTGREGSRVGVPEEWVGTPAGRVFGDGPLKNTRPTKLVEEV
ncbi:PAPA-1-like conserved region-domain-containing protein [Aspergillus ambiguus]|uniref:PAPA-1-like domain-containing protein n=1 Tax=Aspergillus ambiguus TaxID=176160 RepID=UPI003CCE4BDC